MRMKRRTAKKAASGLLVASVLLGVVEGTARLVTDTPTPLFVTRMPDGSEDMFERDGAFIKPRYQRDFPEDWIPWTLPRVRPAWSGSGEAPSGRARTHDSLTPLPHSSSDERSAWAP